MDSDAVFDAWAGLVDPTRTPQHDLALDLPLQKSERGGSGSFRARASDGSEVYVKAPNHAQGGKVLVSEFVTAAIGNYLGPGICTVRPIEVDSTFVSWEFKDGHALAEGWGTASSVVPFATDENGSPGHRLEDNNAARHVTMFALYDLCWGGDGQWLFNTDDATLHSHDHGWYFPPEGQDWTIAELRLRVAEPRNCPWDAAGLSKVAVEEVGRRLRDLERSFVAALLNQVPTSWPVEAEDLEALGAFIECRSRPVADRLEKLV